MSTNISIAIATYNGAKYIETQIDSILNQTLKPYEIIITDDSSTDNTVELLKRFQSKHDFIKLFVNDSNKGVTKTFENSVKNCTGDYIALSDQDDIWMPHKLDVLVTNLKEEDAVYGNSLLVDQNGKSLGVDFKTILIMRSLYIGSPLLLSNCVPGHAILMKKNFAKMILPFPEVVMFDKWIGFSAAAGSGLKFVDEILVHYRQHDTNTVGTRKSKNKKIRKTNTEIFNQKLLELKDMQKAPIKEESTKRILAEMIKHFHRKWSLRRSIFFFKNIDTILLLKNKPHYRKILFCIKMFFKPNY
jgi:glycosyltransferase involved in cell wall biosynthesis